MKNNRTTLAIPLMLIANTLLSAFVCAQTISTIAGNGTQGYAGDGVTATSTGLNYPHGVFVDASGNVYIADYSNARIRKVTASTGLISTIAGNGTPGFSGDGGLATAAELRNPASVFVDTADNMYIADVANHRIRKVEASTGIISTIAGNGTPGFSGDGGAATGAQLNQPYGVFADTYGNVYIADDNNYRVRKITASTGIISTIAGNGIQGYSGDGGIATGAELNSLVGICVDTSGNVYIADLGNNRIRKVDGSTGTISTIAGNGSSSYSGDGGAATAAGLYFPYGVFADASRNVYIADSYNHRIRKVNATTGIISTIAGNGTQGYSGDGGAATNAQLNLPIGVCADASGNVFIADDGNGRIREVMSVSSINEYSNVDSGFMIYPDPANENIFIQSSEKIKNAMCLNYIGQSVETKFDNNLVNISGLSEGVYFITITTQEGKRLTRKFIKQ